MAIRAGLKMAPQMPARKTKNEDDGERSARPEQQRNHADESDSKDVAPEHRPPRTDRIGDRAAEE